MISYYELIDMVCKGNAPEKIEYNEDIYNFCNDAYWTACSFIEEDLSMKIMQNKNIKIVKPILDEKEKEYLSYNIKAWNKKVKYIRKSQTYYSKEQYLSIKFIDNIIALPYFEVNKMYKGMELDKEYTLEELGLK